MLLAITELTIHLPLSIQSKLQQARLPLVHVLISFSSLLQGPKRKTARHNGNACARSDCPEPQVTAESELFIVEKLVGRKKVDGYVYMWLAKWEG